MGFANMHAHKAHAAKTHHARATTPNANCTRGGFYKSPSYGATIDALKPLVISWDSTCIDSEKLDIHLGAPGWRGDNNEIYIWKGVSNSEGQKTVNIDPRWWNSTSEITAQLTIVTAGQPISTTMLPAGPVITATYDGTPISAPLTNSDSSAPLGPSGTSKSLPGGKTAAAVIIPLLFIGLGIFAYLRYQRRAASQKSKRFSQVLDKRMSTISADWKSMSAAGATAAIRQSMAIDRASTAFSFGAIRPSMDIPAPQMKQVRTGTGVGLRNPGVAAAVAAERASRISRVSFADTVGRPSVDSRRTRATAAQSTYDIPPVPTRRDVVSGVPSVYPDSEIEKRDEKEKEYEYYVEPVSPRQTSGPLTLTPEDIHARIHGRLSPAPEKNEEYDEVMPALSMMRTTQDEYLLPQAPVPAHTSPSPPHSAFTISAYTHPSPGAPPMMTPDDMLRAYAVRNSASASASPSSFSSPKSKGRKLSIRASLGILRRGDKDKDKEKERAPSPMISSPVPGSFMDMGGAGAGGMAGVGTRNVARVPPQPQYVVGEDEEYGVAGAYVGMGMAN